MDSKNIFFRVVFEDKTLVIELLTSVPESMENIYSLEQLEIDPHSVKEYFELKNSIEWNDSYYDPEFAFRQSLIDESYLNDIYSAWKIQAEKILGKK